MPKFTFVCDSCGAVFEQEVQEEESLHPFECPKCHSREVQLELSMFSVYGYGDDEDSGCSGSNSGFR